MVQAGYGEGPNLESPSGLGRSRKIKSVGFFDIILGKTMTWVKITSRFVTQVVQ